MYNMQDLYRRSSLAIIRAKKRTKSEDDPAFLEGAKRILDFMYNAWQEQRCCDVVIKVQGGEMHAHSVAFGAYSESLANSFFGYSSGEVINIDLSDFRRDVVTCILHFLYTTELDLNCHIVGQVVSCAVKLGLDMVVYMCMDYLSKVDVENAVLHFSIAENNNMKDLKEKLRAYILNNFTAVSQTKHFIYIPFERLLSFLRDENLTVGTEMDVFRAIVNWVDHDREARLQYSSELLQCVRFSLMPAEVLASEVESSDWIFADQSIWKDCLYTAMKHNALAKTGSRSSMTPKLNQRKCSPERKAASTPVSYENACDKNSFGDGFIESKAHNGKLVTVSAAQPEKTPAVKSESMSCPGATSFSESQATISTSASAMSPIATKAVPLPNSREDKNNSGNVFRFQTSDSALLSPMIPKSKTLACQLATYQETTSDAPLPTHVICVGGIDLDSINPRKHSKALISFVPVDNQWNRAECELPSCLHHHGVAVVNDKLFVVGGAIFKGDKNFGIATNQVWVFDARNSDWLPVATMQHARAYLAVAVWRNKIFAIAGENEEKEKLSSIECYDEEVNQWKHLTHIPGGARVGAAAAIHQDGLFVVGGFNRDLAGNKHGVLSDVSFYDLLFNSWIMLKDLEIPRCHAGLINVNDRLFLLGGRTRCKELGATSLPRMEEYNLDKDQWVMKASMNSARHDMGCAVVGNLLYVIGGIDGRSKTCLGSVECYNSATDEWVDGVANFPYPVAGIACISVTAINAS